MGESAQGGRAYLYPILLNARPISLHYQLQNIDGLGLGLCTEELPVHIHLFSMGEREFIDEVLSIFNSEQTSIAGLFSSPLSIARGCV